MIEPSTAVQVTEEFKVPVTVAVSWVDPPLFSDSEPGLTITVMEDNSVIVVDANAVGSA